MARPLHKLMELANYDGRFYKGTIKDWGTQGNDANWIAGREPVFVGTNNHAVGLRFANGQAIYSASASIPVEAPFAVEMTLVGRNFVYGGNPGYLLALPAIYVRMWILPNGQIGFNPGVLLTTAAGVAVSGIPLHLIASRDESNNGVIYKDGIEVASGSVGDRGGTGIYIGNRDSPYDRAFDGVVYLQRLYSDHIAADEAPMIYEHERIKFSPGAPKRSGIYTPVGG